MSSSKKGFTIVTGSNGFIGRNLCDRLTRKGIHVIAIDKDKSENINADVFLNIDITNSNDLKIPELLENEVTSIYHLAGSANVPKSMENPRNDFLSNLIGTFNLLEIARNLNLNSFIFSSSVSVIGNTIDLPISETAGYSPTTPYGASKMSSEAYCIAYNHCYNIPTKIIRMFNVYGPGKKGLVVYDLIKKIILNPKVLEILGDGKQVRDFLYIDDAINGLCLIAQSGQNGHIYNLASGIPITLMELIDIISKKLFINDLKVLTIGESWKGDVSKWYANIEKITKLGFKSEVDLDQGIKITIDWVKKYGL